MAALGDWELVEELYDFLTERANDDTLQAQRARDPNAEMASLRFLHLLDTLHAKAAQNPSSREPTIEYLRAQVVLLRSRVLSLRRSVPPPMAIPSPDVPLGRS